MKKVLFLLVAVLVLQIPAACFAEAADSTGRSDFPTPKFPHELRGLLRNGTVPSIYSDKTEVGSNEVFTISWDEPDASMVALWVIRDDDTEFECLYTGDSTYSYQLTLGNSIRMSFCIIAYYSDKYEQSEFIDICLNESTASILRGRGYDNTWNILALIFPKADAPNLQASWDENYVARIKAGINDLPRTLYGLSEGQMNVGRISVLTMDEPITSVSGGQNDLTYGENGDVNFDYLFDHMDVQLVIVYAPLGDIAETWAGLGGGWITYRGNNYYNIILNCVYETNATWPYNGQSYNVSACLPLHEVLHCVETNSRQNGWAKFVALHDNLTVGYEGDPNYDYFQWYADLMTDRIRTGDPGFREESYLIKHKSIPEGMRSGIHTDSDGRIRIYNNGLPDRNTLITQYEGKWVPVKNGELLMYEKAFCTPASLKRIEDDAFKGTDAQWIELNAGLAYVGSNAFAQCADLMGLVIPSTVSYISPDAFADSPNVVLYAIDNPYAVQYANDNQIECVSLQ